MTNRYRNAAMASRAIGSSGRYVGQPNGSFQPVVMPRLRNQWISLLYIVVVRRSQNWVVDGVVVAGLPA